MTMVLGMMPWSIALIAAFGWMVKRRLLDKSTPLYTFLISWLVAMFIILQCAHSKLNSYILPAMPALAVITGDYIYDLLAQKKWKTFYVLIGLSSVLIVGLSLAIFLVATGAITLDFEYYEYLPDTQVAIAFLALSAAIVGGCFLFAGTSRHRLSVYILGLQLPVLLMFCFLSRDRFENYVSSRQVGAYMLEHYDVNNAVLCSKILVRGVRYCTNKDVAVIDGTFFSPHPIPIVNTDQEIADFLADQQTTYAIVRASQLRKLKQVSGTMFELTEMLHLGDAYLVRVNAM